MRLFPFILCGLFLLTNCESFGQDAYDFKFKTYTYNDGLVHNYTKKCLQDSKGFLWIITQHGLSRFDGVNFKNFEHSNSDSSSLPENDLEDIAIDSKDNIWLSYRTGLCVYNQSTHRFSFIKENGRLLKSSSIVFDKKKNCIWSVNINGYTKINCSSFIAASVAFTVTETFSQYINKIFLDSRQRLWIPYARSRYHCIDLNTGKQYYHAKRVEPTSVYEDENKNIWMTTWQKGFRKIIVQDTGHQHILFSNPYLKIAENEYDFISQGVAQSRSLTPDSILWVIQNTWGILLFNKNSGKFIQQFSHDANDKNGIATDYNESIYCDPSGVLWICTWHGLTKINKQEQQFVSKEIPWLNNQLYNCVTGIADDPYETDIAWLSASGSGISKYRKSTGEILNKYFFYFSGNSFTGTDQNYNWRWTDNFVKDEWNNLWTVSYGGLVKISAGHVSTIGIKDADGNLVYPYAIKQFTKGILWLACSKGIFRINTSNNSQHFFADPDAKNGYAIGDMEQLDEKNLLLSDHRGVRLFNILTQKFSPFSAPIISRDTSNEQTCLAMKVINNKLYMGTLAGLKVLDLTSKATYFIGKEQGIDKVQHRRLQPDNNQNLWIYTAGGLFKYDTRKNSFEKFTNSDGIYDLSEDAINFFPYNGRLYIGYRMAITYFDPKQVNVNTVPSHPVITEMQVNGKTMNQSLDSFRVSRLKLSHDQNELMISYTAPDFTNADKITFQYKLEGYDKTWIQAGTRRSVTYNNLPPGKYTFLLKAANSSGVWNDETAVLHFDIATPFWKTWWFRTLLVVLLLSAIYAIYRYRLREVKNLYEVRSNISRSLHDEVGATLSSINIYSDVARNKTSDPAVKQLVDKVYNASANAMENMSDIVWYVNPTNDLVENLLVRMREYALPLLEARSINVVFDARQNIEDLKTTMPQRHNMYLIFKEALNNSLKYSQAKNVHILLEKENNDVKMTIGDDGKGFTADKQFSGNGIKNMYFRAKAISGTLDIDSSEGNGTIISLQFPIA